MRRPFMQRHDSIILSLAVVIALLLSVGFQAWDRRQADERSSTTCAQVDRLYSDLVQLMAGDSTFTPEQILAMVRQRTARLAAADCS